MPAAAPPAPRPGGATGRARAASRRQRSSRSGSSLTSASRSPMTSWASPSSRRVASRRSRATAAQLGEPGDLRLGPRLPGVVGVRRSAPQPERGLQGAHRVSRRLPGRRLDRRLERPRVHGVRCQAQHVAGAGAGDDAVALPGRRVGLEPPAQVADVGLQRAGGVGGRLVAPDAVDQPIGRDHLVPRDDQPRQHGALTPPAEVHDRAVPRRRELAEHVQVKLRLPVHPTSSPRLRRAYGRPGAAGCPEIGHVAHPSSHPKSPSSPRGTVVSSTNTSGAHR